MSSSRSLLTVAIAAAIATALTGCHRPAEPKPVADAAPAWKLDEGQLLQPIRFLASDVDASKNACVDLAGYTNSKWLAENPIPADQTRWGAFNVLRERSLQVQKQLAEQIAAKAQPAGIEKVIGDLWATGMDEAKLNAEGIAPLRDRLGEIEGLKDGPSIAAYLRAVAARGENPLFGFGPQPDFKDSTVQMAAAFQGGTGLPDKTYYFDARYKAIRDAYVKHIARVLELSGIPAATAATEAKDVMAFETRLAKASKSEEELQRDVSLYYNPVTPEEADKLTPNFPWTTFFESQKVAPAKFSLAMPDFHREVSRMLADEPVGRWKSYLRYHLVDSASPYLSDEFVTERFEFYSRTLNGQKEQRARWKRVLSHIEGAAGEAMGQIYVQVAFPPESRERMEKLVLNLRESLKARIENLTWMSDTTKAKALEKWSAFGTKIGYPTKWRDWSGLATSRQSYLDNILAADAFNYRWELDKIGKPVDKTEWHMTPQTVNAYNDPQQNEIVFPAAILQPPFFDPKADDALNYGAIGAVIGHELTHGYDDQGARFGPTGNFEEWWTPEDKKKFQALTGKLVKQYSGYEAIPGEKVNGNLTLGENIADLGGLNIAYDAMQRATKDQPDPKVDGLTRDQRFFLGFAAAWRDQVRPEALRVQLASDPHSPGAVRANGTPSNVPAFAAAFSCKAGDPMANAPDRQVVIW